MYALRNDQYLSSFKKPFGKRGFSAKPITTNPKKEEIKKAKPPTISYLQPSDEAEIKQIIASSPASARADHTIKGIPSKIKELQEFVISDALKNASYIIKLEVNKKFNEVIRFVDTTIADFDTETPKISYENIAQFKAKILDFESQLTKRNEDFEYKSLIYQLKQMQFAIEKITPTLQILLPKDEKLSSKYIKPITTYEQNRIIEGVTRIKKGFEELEGSYALLNTAVEKYTKSSSACSKISKKLVECVEEHMKDIRANRSPSVAYDLNMSYKVQSVKGNLKFKGDLNSSNVSNNDKSKLEDKSIKLGFDSPKRLMDKDLKDISKEYRDLVRSLETYKKYVNQSNMKMANVYSNDMSSHVGKLDKLLDKVNHSFSFMDGPEVNIPKEPQTSDFEKQRIQEISDENQKLREQRNNYQQLYEKQTSELSTLLKKQRESTDIIARLKEKNGYEKEKEDSRINVKIEELIKQNKLLHKDKDLMLQEVNLYKTKMETMEKIITEDCNYGSVKSMIAPLFQGLELKQLKQWRTIENKIKSQGIKLGQSVSILTKYIGNGEKISAEEHQILKNELLEMSSQMEAYTTEINKKDDELNELTNDLQTLEALMKEKEIMVKDKQQLIGVLTQEKQAVSQELQKSQQKYDKDIKLRTNRINELQEDLKSVGMALDERQKQCESHSKRVDENTVIKKEQEECILKITNALEEKEAELSKCMKTIDNLNNEIMKAKLEATEKDIQSQQYAMTSEPILEQSSEEKDESNGITIIQLQEDNAKLEKERDDLKNDMQVQQMNSNNQIQQLNDELIATKAKLENHHISEETHCNDTEIRKKFEELLLSLDSSLHEDVTVEDMHNQLIMKLDKLKERVPELEAELKIYKDNDIDVQKYKESIKSIIILTGVKEIPENGDLIEILRQRVETNASQFISFENYCKKIEDELDAEKSKDHSEEFQQELALHENAYKDQLEQLSKNISEKDSIIQNFKTELERHFGNSTDSIESIFERNNMKSEDVLSRLITFKEMHSNSIDSLNQANNEIELLNGKIQLLNQQLHEDGEEIKGHKEVISSLEDNHNLLITKMQKQFDEKINECDNKIQQLQNELNNSESKYKSLQSQCDQYKLEISKLSEQLSISKAQLANNTTFKDDEIAMQKDNANLTKDKKELAYQNEELQQAISILETENIKLSNELKSLRGIYESAEVKYADISNMFNKYKAEKENELSEATTHISQLTTQNHDMRLANSTAEKQLIESQDYLKNNSSDKERKIDELTKSYNDANSRYELLMKENTDLKNELSQLHDQIKLDSANLSTLNDKIMQLSEFKTTNQIQYISKIKSLEESITLLNEEILKLSELKGIEPQISGYKNAQHQYEEQIELLRQQIKELTQENTNLDSIKARCSDLENSNKALTIAYDTLNSKYNTEIEQLNETIQKFEGEAKYFHKEIEGKNAMINSLNLTIDSTNISELQAEIAILKENIKTFVKPADISIPKSFSIYSFDAIYVSRVSSINNEDILKAQNQSEELNKKIEILTAESNSFKNELTNANVSLQQATNQMAVSEKLITNLKNEISQKSQINDETNKKYTTEIDNLQLINVELSSKIETHLKYIKQIEGESKSLSIQSNEATHKCKLLEEKINELTLLLSDSKIVNTKLSQEIIDSQSKSGNEIKTLQKEKESIQDLLNKTAIDINLLREENNQIKAEKDKVLLDTASKKKPGDDEASLHAAKISKLNEEIRANHLSIQDLNTQLATANRKSIEQREIIKTENATISSLREIDNKNKEKISNLEQLLHKNESLPDAEKELNNVKTKHQELLMEKESLTQKNAELQKDNIAILLQICNEFDITEAVSNAKGLCVLLKNKFEEITTNAKKYCDVAAEKQKIIEDMQIVLQKKEEQKQVGPTDVANMNTLIEEKAKLKMQMADYEDKVQGQMNRINMLMEENERNKSEVKKFIISMPNKKYECN